MIEGFARIRGVDKYGVQIYTDAGVSGAVKLGMRPAGEQLLEAMKPGDTVIASKLDRMFRSASDAIAMFDLFRERGVDLVLFDISNEPVSSGVGKLIMTILAAVADMERIRIKERTAEGRKAAKAKGRAVGNVPFGYRKVAGTSELEIDEGETFAASRMRELYQQKLSLPRIADLLRLSGYVSRSGTPYTPMAIRRVVMEAQQ